MKIAIIAAALPPQLDGIGDYTANLAVELAKAAPVQILTSTGQAHDPLPGVVTIPAFTVGEPRSVRQLEGARTADTPDWLLLQYNPFSYGRWGLNLHLPLTIRRIKRARPGLRFAIMVHEPFVRVQSLKFAVMSLWQRWQLWSLGHSAEAIFVSIELWTEELQRWFPATRVVHLPVGSNIPCLGLKRCEARQRLGISDDVPLLGLFGSISPGYMLPWVVDAARAVSHTGAAAHVLYIGPDQDLVRAALQPIPVIGEARLAAAEVSRQLAALDVYLAPFVDGISTRRTSFMAALQHGAACVGTIGHNTGQVLMEHRDHAYLLAPVATPDVFQGHLLRLMADAPMRVSLGGAARQLYQTHFAWPTIADRLLTTLRTVS